MNIKEKAYLKLLLNKKKGSLMRERYLKDLKKNNQKNSFRIKMINEEIILINEIIMELKNE